MCTGILLNSQWILTAGNCILNPKEGFGQYLMDPQYFAVSGSSSNLIEQFDLGRYDIKEIILQRTNDYQHPKLALLKLTRPIKDFGNRFKAVCIDGNSNPTNGVEVHVPGWTSYNTKISMRRQVHVNLRQSTYKLTLPTESINEAILIDENHSEPSVMDLGSPVLMPEGGKYPKSILSLHS